MVFDACMLDRLEAFVFHALVSKVGNCMQKASLEKYVLSPLGKDGALFADEKVAFVLFVYHFQSFAHLFFCDLNV